jgi:hypothetical protein
MNNIKNFLYILKKVLLSFVTYQKKEIISSLVLSIGLILVTGSFLQILSSNLFVDKTKSYQYILQL